MDTSEYLPMFLAEAREHLQELNLAVVRVEEQPDDTDTVAEIFRIAHSFKGMSATMGFAQIAALTHAMEDVFELLRQRRGGLERDAVNVLFECLDALSASVESIDASGDEELDAEPLVSRLRDLVRDRTPEQQVDRHGGAPDPAELAEKAQGRRVVHVTVQLTADCMMPSVRAYMALASLGEHGDLLGSVPTEDGLESFDGRAVQAWLASEHEDDVVAAAAREVADVAAVEITEVGADEAAAEVEDAATELAGGDPAPRAAAPERAAAPGRKSGATVRVDAERLDMLMHFMGELVVHRTRLEGLAAQADVPGLMPAMQELTRSSQALQAMVMQVRMIPVEAVFLRFPRLVRDLSSKLAKQVELRLVGQDTELDRTVVDALGDPLVHLVRNALDHGLESPTDRAAAGKAQTGVLEISARHAGGSVVIAVTDDGRGIEPEKVARIAVERGLITAEAVPTVDAARAAELLFTPGFSTAEVTSDISGRGVGMDAVRATIRELGGEVLLQSEPGQGTTALIRLPLTLAIMSALLVEASGLPFAIPLDRVERTVRLPDHSVRSVAGRRMLVMRDGVLPLLDAGEHLGRGAGEEHEHAVIVRAHDRRLALSVARLVGQRELVTRPLPPEVGDRAAVSGGAVLSGGDIALIVDCDALTSATGAAGLSVAAA